MSTTAFGQMKQRSGRPVHRTENIGAAYTSNNELHGHELGPALNRMVCRECGAEVVGTCKCPKCGADK